MTTVAYRDGILAADTCYTEESSEGGSRQYQCNKLYDIRLANKDGYPLHFRIGFAGGSGWKLFLDWVRNGADWSNIPEFSKAHDFGAIVVRTHRLVREVFVIDSNMEPEPLMEPYHAIGSGAKCALIALDMGASAEEAVERAARRDPYTRWPFMKLTCNG